MTKTPINKFKNARPVSRKMTVETFIVIPDNPRQRDTVQHAKKAGKLHLRIPHVMHCKVNVGELPGGKRFKLDGHTRAYLWEQGLLDAPETLSADIWKCKDESQLKDLYLTFDNRDAAEVNNQLLFGTLRAKGVDVEGRMLRQSGLPSALQHIYGAGDAKKLLLNVPDEIIPAIGVINDANFSGHKVTSGLLAAMITTVYRDGADALEFWFKYVRDEGIKQGRTWDGVYGVCYAHGKVHEQGFGRTLSRELMRRALSCYKVWLLGEMMTRIAPETKVTEFVPNAKHY